MKLASKTLGNASAISKQDAMSHAESRSTKELPGNLPLIFCLPSQSLLSFITD
jgi:hypothetical protein